MYGFEYFNELQTIQESLDSPADFYMTDDTQIPTRIYGVFSIDEDQYGMSLELSDHDGIYLLSMYRILAKKPRKWSFKKPSHVRPGLSTLLKFVEACVPFVKSKMKGVICQVSGKNVDRYIRFAERLLKRLYITSFRVLPTKKSPNYKIYNWENIFFTRVGVNPKAVFSDSKFKKYDFDGETLSVEMSAEIKPKRPEKKTLKTEPSKRYSFGDLETEQITIDSDVFDRISKIEKVSTPKKEKKKEKYEIVTDSQGLTADNKKLIQGIATSGGQLKIKKFYSLVNKDPSELLAAFINRMVEDGTITNIDDYDQLQLRLSDLLVHSDANRYVKQYLDKIEVIDQNKWPKAINDEYLGKAVGYVKSGKIKKTKTKNILNVTNQFQKTIAKAPLFYRSANTKTKPPAADAHVIFETNLSPESLVADLPGSGTIEYTSDFYDMKYGQTKKGYDTFQVVDYLQFSKGYQKAIKKHPSHNVAYSYTGSGYETINGNMRGAFSAFVNKSSLSSYKNKLETGDMNKMQQMIYDMKPLENSMWVYRGTDLPEKIEESIIAGEDFVDPAFLSTTVDPTMYFGGQHMFRIFLPKGSNVLPMLDYSKHSNERELILPALSVLKIIRVDQYKVYSGKSLYITCIFVGSVYNDFKQKYLSMNESKGVFYMPENKKRDQYDPKDKFSSNIDAEQLKAAQQFAKQVASVKKK